MKEVKITKNYIISRFDKEDVDIFKNELFIYLLGKQKNISYIPKLIDYNCDKLYIKTENVGITLQDYCDNYGCEFEDSFIPKIKIIYDKFIKLGYFHNDLRLKNIVINPNSKKLYLIDFEFTDIKYKDLDDENIIKKFKILSKYKSKSKSK
jgi:tRNA A-37 threonylcarbamoyl transferase component Bud32|tara:strand:- start:777 stop:1229 length:453 start_codon:yes stop_codon:yes gene_type:complete